MKRAIAFLSLAIMAFSSSALRAESLEVDSSAEMETGAEARGEALDGVAHPELEADVDSEIDTDLDAGKKHMDDGTSRIRNADRFDEDKVEREGHKVDTGIDTELNVGR